MQSDSPPLDISLPVGRQSMLGLVTEKESPRLIKRIPFLRGLWRNPVFQRNYARSRIKRIVGNRQAFLVGLGWSLIVNLLAFMEPDLEMRISLALIFSFLLPLGALFGLTYVRMFILCLTTTPIGLRKDIAESELGGVFTTPLSSRQLYLGESLGNFVRGIVVIEALFYLAAGALIPFIFMNYMPYTQIYDVDWLGIMMIFADCAMMAFFLLTGLVLMMLLLSLSSALYAISVPAFSAILLTLLHYIIVTSIAYAVGGMFGDFSPGFYPGYYNPVPMSDNSSLLFLASQLAKTFTVIFLCQVTAAMGVAAFAKSRRPGYYVPEMSTSPGLED